MKTIRKSVSLKTFVAAILIMLAFAGLIFNLGRAGYVGDETEQWYTPSQEASCIVGLFNSTHFYMQNHTGHGYSGYEGYEFLSTNDDTVIQYAIDNVTTDGGSVFVKSGTYTATVVLKTSVRLILDKNAATISVSINAGATAILEDYNAARIRYWVSGTLTYDEDMTAGSLTLIDGIYSGWVNSTSINADNYYLDDQTLGFVGPTAFTIDQSGSYTRAWYGANNTLAFQSTNASAILNNAVGNLTGNTKKGRIFVRNGAYTINTDVLLGKGTYLKGESVDGVVFTAGATLTTCMFNIYYRDPVNDDNGFQISDLTIDMNDQNGHAIYGGYLRTALPVSGLEYLKIYNVKVGYCAIYAVDPFNIRMANIRITTAGTGVKLEAAYLNLKSGNLVMTDIRVGTLGDNVVCFNFTGLSDATAMNLIQGNLLMVVSDTSREGCISFYATYLLTSTFVECDFETTDWGVFLDHGCDGVTFVGGLITCGAETGSIGAYIHGAAGGTTKRNIFNAVQISGEASVYTDASTGSSYRNVLRDCFLTGNGTVDIGTETLIYNCQNYVTEFVGSHASTVNAHTVGHGLDVAPNHLSIEIAFAGAGELMIASAYNIGASTFDVYLYWTNGTAVDASHSPQTITFRAIYQPNGAPGTA